MSASTPSEQGLPALDVVIATRNRPQLLAEALAAVLDQDYPGLITVHVVFDQSEPDPSIAAAAAGRAERRVLVHRNERTPGLAGARNSGILAGTAPLVAFCDDDDVWLPQKATRQIAELLDSGADTVVSGIVVEYDGERTERVPRIEDLEISALVRNRVMEAHPSTVTVRREALLERIGLVDEEIPGSYGEDFDWIIRAAQNGPLALAAAPLVRVRWGGSQFSQNWDVIVRAIDYGLVKHQVFHADRRALARLQGRRAFALAALHRRGALRAAAQTVRTAPSERRAYLAAAVALRLVSAERLLDLAHRRGHGI
ncbi:glycosyltransferase family A protein [Nocardioides dubius]|uniref:Glycosyltransferase 2-like domain-containing protein n=1 Tax=Nocardioides dubius TaxID=317019 RepID=A0ABN1TJS5_9ACTN